MSLPKKGSRSITVDGKRYRYLVKESNHPTQKPKLLSVTVQEDIKNPGRVVQFKTEWGAEITPRLVGYNIRRAVAEGWDPSAKDTEKRLDWHFND